MYTETESVAKREMEHFKTDLDATLYTVSGVAFLLGVGRNCMKKLTIPKTNQHGTGKSWIRKSDLIGWLRQLEGNPKGEQAQLLQKLKDEHHARRVKKVSTKKLTDRLGFSDHTGPDDDLWGFVLESGRPMDDTSTDMQQQAERLLEKKYPGIREGAELIAQEILGAGLR